MTNDRFAYFDSLYESADDPYGVRSRWYESRKRDILMASLPQRRYENAYEPGCGTGELTAALAQRCTRLTAADFSARALATAERRCAPYAHVQLAQHRLPEDWPVSEQFDLIVLSEVGYFLDANAFQTLVHACEVSLSPNGTLVACDWRYDFSERAMQTSEVHGALDALLLYRLCRHEEDDFLLQVWTRAAGSVAQREGLVKARTASQSLMASSGDDRRADEWLTR